ncbi:DUF882 domain-containing protein [Aureimonas flava]|uniref:DUF882 domain-containing protein n=1 Tax=Aureimonas flava TaxID=2320271 RepID=A0A3A1WGJ5_9HYPH|nr:D-Ala-D-Ala carboxypeptidase family metallohydrolase [Aureimonas flava]RIX99516.1 DUF882 domain-containing protein [Aureimonas flava]
MASITNLGGDLAGISPRARAMLDGMAGIDGLPELRIRSGYRDPARNAKAGGAKGSQHIHGNALDLDISGYTDEQKSAILGAARAHGANGVGIYPSGNSLHIDVRDTPSMWGWNPAGAYAKADLATAPAWAKGHLTAMLGAVERGPLPDLAAAPKANRRLPSWWNTLEQHSASAGVDSDTLYRFGGAESMFRNIDNQSGPGGKPSSTATGPFQITDGTWGDLQKTYPHLNLTDRRDPEQQAKAAPYLLRQYTDDVQRRVGRKITQGEQYLAWFLGPRDAAKVLNAPKGANPLALVTPASVASNPTVFKGMTTVDELRAWADRKMTGPGIDGAAAPAPVDMTFTEQFKDARLSILDAVPNDPLSPRERVAQERAMAGDAYSLGEGIYRALGQEATATIGSWLAQGPQVSDPNFRVTPEILKAKAADIPDKFLDFLGGSLSDADFDRRADRLRQDLEIQRKLGAMGGTGVALQLGAAIVDPAGWLAALAAAPIGGAVKTGRVGKILLGAAEGAAGNLLLEGAVAGIKPTWESDQLIYAGAGGLIFGAAFGAIGKTSKDILGDTTALTTQADEAMKHIDATFGSSIGAAQNNLVRSPVRTDTDAFMTRNFADAYGKGALSAARFDLTGKLKASDNPLVRALGHVFAEESVGNADGSATLRAVSEDQVKLQKQSEAVWYRDLGENWRDYAKRNDLNAFKDAHTGGLADFNRQVMDAARNTDPTAQFDPAVARQAASFKGIMERYRRLAQGDRLEFDGTMRAPLPGFANLSSSDNYVPRLIHWGNFRALVDELGTAGLTKLVKGAVRGVNADLDEAIIDRMAEGYVKRLSNVEAGQELTSGRIFSSTDLDELRMNLEGAGLAPTDIEAVLRPMATKDANGAGTARGKRRQLLNENFSMALPTKSGQREVKLTELFENDMDRVFQSYNRNMSGQIALAGLRIKNPNFRPDEADLHPEFLIDGIHNRGDWDKILKQVRDVASSDQTSPKARESVDADIDRLQFLYDGIAGNVSKFDASSTAKGMRLVRDYIFTRVMGQVGFAQLAEIGMITSGVGLKTAIKSMPSLKGFLRDARAGRLADEDARALEWISTGGTDWIRGMSHVASDEFGTPLNVGGAAGMMDKVEAGMSRLTRAQSAASGMSSINTYLQRWASKAALYKFLDMSEEGARVNRKRMRVLGLDDTMQDRIFASIRKHSGDMAGEWEGSQMRRLNMEKWDPDVRASFEHAIFRWTRKLVQENDIGQTNTILGSSIGKFVTQFRGFMFGGWTKNTLHNIHMRDWESLSSVITTMTFGAMAYTAQRHLQSLGRADRDEFLARELDTKRLIAASFQRAGFSSMFPAGIDQMGYLLGFDPLFDTRTSGTPSRGLTSFPAINLLDDTMNALHGVSSAARGETYRRQDARALWSLVPFQNTLPMLWFFNNTVGRLPEG